MHSRQGSRWVRLILGTVAVAACTREAPNREGEAKGGAIVPSRFTQLTVVHDRLWVTTDVGIVVIEPVAEKWTLLDLGGQRIVPTSVVSCGSDIWLRLEDSLALLDLKTRSLRISATMGARQPGGPEEPLTTRLSGTAREVCGPSALWVYDSGVLFKAPFPGGVNERYVLPRIGDNTPLFSHAEFLGGAVYFLVPYSVGGPDSTRGLFRFDPSASTIHRVGLPENAFPWTLARVDDGLLVRATGSKAFLLTADGQPWVEAPQIYGDSLLARGDSVVWVGASYDVSPASYFVLRYIHDAREPKDLLVLPRFGPAPAARSALSFLGMLWAVSDNKVLRIDPTAEELVTYQVKDTSGQFVRRAFHLKTETAGLRYLEGDTLRQAPE